MTNAQHLSSHYGNAFYGQPRHYHAPTPAEVMIRMGTMACPDKEMDGELQPPATPGAFGSSAAPSADNADSRAITVRPSDIFPPPRPPRQSKTEVTQPAVPPPPPVHPPLTVTTSIQLRAPSPSASGVRRSGRLREPPSGAAGPANRRQLWVYLPPDVDMDFRLEIGTRAGPGISLDCGSLLDPDPTTGFVAPTVGRASLYMDKHFPDGVVHAQRAYFAYENPPTAVAPAAKDPMDGYTLGHLLVLLVQKQLRHWSTTSQQGRMDLQHIVGRDQFAQCGVKVEARALHIIAVRHRKTKGGAWCYFPEIEVRP